MKEDHLRKALENIREECSEILEKGYEKLASEVYLIADKALTKDLKEEASNG